MYKYTFSTSCKLVGEKMRVKKHPANERKRNYFLFLAFLFPKLSDIHVWKNEIILAINYVDKVGQLGRVSDKTSVHMCWKKIKY